MRALGDRDVGLSSDLNALDNKIKMLRELVSAIKHEAQDGLRELDKDKYFTKILNLIDDSRALSDII